MTVAIKKIGGILRESIKKINNKGLTDGIELSKLILSSDANLKAYYKCENTSDSGPNEYTLTNNGATTFTAAKFTNGANLNGSSQYLSYAGNMGIAGNSNISVSYWIKLNAEIESSLYRTFLHVSQLTQNRYFGVNYEYNSGTRRLKVDSSGTASYYNVALSNTWHHIVAIRDVTNSLCYLYLDGIQVITNGGVGTGTWAYDYFHFGSDNGSNFVPGLMDDVAVLNRVLTGAEVLSIYNIQIKKFAGVSNV